MRPRQRLLLLGLGCLAVAALAPFVGAERLPLTALLEPGGVSPEAVILWQIRLPRVLVALLGGAGLALGGAVFQAVFRNPLAAPYTLGVASGAALGVAVVSRLGLVLALGAIPLTSVGAFAGALLAVAVVWSLAHVRQSFSGAVLLLAGVAMSFFFSSLILLLQYTASLGNSFRIVRWLMGGLGAVDLASALQLLPFVLVGVVVLAMHARELDLFATGADLAASRGVDVVRARRTLFLTTSFMVGGVVAVCGPVGFVGIMVPHICRLLVGETHRSLLPASCLFGGAFLVVCDTLARTIMAPAELPVGVITAFLGGPFFIWLLLRRGGLRQVV
jgi:iron complex transport system permease protein